MMRLLPHWLVGLRLALAALAANCVCGLPPGVAAENTAPSPLAHVDWALVIDDIDCSPNNRGVEVRGMRYSDVNGDGVPDAFVWVVCWHDTSPWPDILEVFDGASDPKSPRRIGVLTTMNDRLQITELAFDGSKVIVSAKGYAEDDPNCCPSLQVRKSFIWNGRTFERE